MFIYIQQSWCVLLFRVVNGEISVGFFLNKQIDNSNRKTTMMIIESLSLVLGHWDFLT